MSGVDISIIIVNYNVRYFILKCLESVYSNVNQLNIEVFVVDNASVDGSPGLIQEKFPQVNFIQNTDNLGFSKANNQAMRKANGKYFLILNPDTILQEDTLNKCFEYMEQHSQIGALGVKMIDGRGNFLPESKRDLPTIWNSLAKLSGLASIFPNSKMFNGYALGYLSPEEIHQISVLCGAFMFVRASVVEKVGMFDEQFFMYGEDIDWSKRIKEGGYQIVYYPKTSIIHFKGESTKKSSLNYVKVFYGAMIKYVNKHYTGFSGKLFAFIIRIGISIRAAFSGLKRIFFSGLEPGALFILTSILSYIFAGQWAIHFHQNPTYYDTELVIPQLLVYAFTWSFVLYFIGYFKKKTFQKRIEGIFYGLLIILSMYALLPEALRTSRVLILSSAFIALITSTLLAQLKWLKLTSTGLKKILIVSTMEHGKKISSSLEQSGIHYTIVGFVYPKPVEHTPDYLNHIGHLGPLASALKINEIIFSSKDLSMKDIVHQMTSLDAKLSFKISGDNSLMILGSDSKNTSGELYTVDLQYRLSDDYYQHVKRSFDLAMSIILFTVSPILLLFNKFQFKAVYGSIFRVFFAYATWIGYAGDINDYSNLPFLKKGIFTVPSDENSNALNNRYYAKHFNIWKDIEYTLKHLNAFKQ